MASYRIDNIKRDGENVKIAYSIILDEAASAAAQTALATADAALATAKAGFASAQDRWEREALPTLPPTQIEEIRRVVTLAQSALNKAQVAQSEMKTKAEPDGGRDSIAIPLADIGPALTSGDAEKKILALAEPQVKERVKRALKLRQAFDAIGKKNLGRVVGVA